VIPLAVLATLSPIESIAYHTYQSVSGSGHKGVLALTRKLDYYPVDITQTVLPHIDSMMGDGYTFEEVKMINETKKILNDPTLRISATCVRVPIERGHGVSVSVVTKEHVSLEAFKKALKKQPMVELKNVPSTIDVARLNKIQVGRLRKDYSHANGLLFYVAADNLYVGAAANAIDILERVIR
jgi:aspartate-semialdehyde dehydrogenase